MHIYTQHNTYYILYSVFVCYVYPVHVFCCVVCMSIGLKEVYALKVINTANNLVVHNVYVSLYICLLLVTVYAHMLLCTCICMCM